MLGVLYVLFALYILFLITVKIYAPFWFHQPVYHTYEIYPRFVSRPYIKLPNIQHRRPNGYCDFRMKTQLVQDMAPAELSDVVSFLQTRSVDSEYFLYHITSRSLQQQLTGISFITLAYDSVPLKLEKILTGCIYSRPVYISFKTLLFVAYFIECVATKITKESRCLLQTHIYRTHEHLPDMKVHLFRKEVELCIGIVPLVRCKTFTFLLRPTTMCNLAKGYFVHRISSKHLDTWKTLYRTIQERFVSVLPELHMTIQWISEERYKFYLLVSNQHIHGIYIFKDNLLTWDTPLQTKKNRTFQLQGSMKSPTCDSLFFFRGFLYALKQYLEETKEMGILVAETTSDNGIIIERWKEKYSLHNETDSAYYLYNLIHPTINANEFFSL